MLKTLLNSLYLILFLFSSCSQVENTESTALTYFDIKSYFLNEASRLSSRKSAILKEVSKNEQQERKTILINDWKKEFDLFIESDINKPSWTSSYKIEINGDTTLYQALTPELRTRMIQVIKGGSKIRSISIKNESLNRLYKSYESLSYYPDSIYVIEKEQQVRFLGNNKYRVTGIFTD
ncbi:hypothetical protein [Albibacterium bauzanense]|uniref:PepSY-like beta-lactamase-inhibitor n=1 Tax=Albibacterium bauzanense TaxID=653929 RepID=A0A4R1M0E3_9SPHI|nr:hypothetical protein [Albibacterium bauzanense]TCK85356.1 hypothetical protein C8N28_0662 [Albibacterium bauzanense]